MKITDTTAIIKVRLDGSESYVALQKSGGLAFQTDSASEMAAFVWGKSAKAWVIYKRVPWYGGDCHELRDTLEAR